MYMIFSYNYTIQKMFSIDMLHKRTRIPFEKMTFRTFFSEKKQTNYDEDEPIDNLWFKENFPQFRNEAYQHEVRNMNILHSMYFDTDDQKTPASPDLDEYQSLDILNLPIHPYIREVFLPDRVLTCYEIIGSDVFKPRHKDDINRFRDLAVETIRILHTKKYFIPELRPDLFTWNTEKQNIETLSFSPSLTSAMKSSNVCDTSLIVHHAIISPFHVLWDMLHSKYETPMIEYKEFKRKFLIFWESILANKHDFKDLPNFCQNIFGKHTGEDFVDYILIKFCVIESDDDKHYIVKDPVKIKNKDYIEKLDWFALALIIKKYHDILNLDPLSSEFIFKCISFQYDPI